MDTLLPASLWTKLKQLRYKVKNWQASRFARDMERSKMCELELASLLSAPVPVNVRERESFFSKKRDLDLEIKHLRIIEDQCWHQKSRIQWLRKGDLNSSYFHKVASGRRRGNLITPAMASLPDGASVALLK